MRAQVISLAWWPMVMLNWTMRGGALKLVTSVVRPVAALLCPCAEAVCRAELTNGPAESELNHLF